MSESELVMGWANRKHARARAVNHLHEMLETLPVTRFPYWFCLVVLMPLSMVWVAFEATRAILTMLVALSGLVLSAILTPFQILFVWLDVSIITVWCFLRAAKKLSGRSE